MKEEKKINGRARVLRRRSDGWNTARLACRLQKRWLASWERSERDVHNDIESAHPRFR